MTSNNGEHPIKRRETASLGSAITSRHLGMTGWLIGRLSASPLKRPSIGWRDRGSLTARLSSINRWSLSVEDRVTELSQKILLSREPADISYEPAQMVWIGPHYLPIFYIEQCALGNHESLGNLSQVFIHATKQQCCKCHFIYYNLFSVLQCLHRRLHLDRTSQPALHLL